MATKQTKQIIFVIIAFLIILVIVGYLVYTNYIIPQIEKELPANLELEKVNTNIDMGVYNKLQEENLRSYGAVPEPKNVGKINPFEP